MISILNTIMNHQLFTIKTITIFMYSSCGLLKEKNKNFLYKKSITNY